jgi:transposase
MLGYDANEECVPMPPTRPAYAPEFKAEAVRLYRTSGRSLKKIASDRGVSTNTLREWVRRAEAEGTPSKLLMQGEREELLRLRRENRVLKEERGILRKAAAFFARETNR